jgi:hypothetical protein
MSENPIVILSVLALLPLVPAILLFKFLPGGNTEVDGLLAGLKVKLGGAFGGYVALTVFLATFYAQSLKPASSSMETWTVVGAVQPTRSPIKCKLVPPLEIDDGNTFEWHIPVPKGAALPKVAFSADGYEGDTLHLAPEPRPFNDRYPVEVDAAKHIVKVKKPIVLQKAAAGSMTAGGL